MCSLFRNRFRNESSRLPGYDYSKSGTYFITICTIKHECYFGEIIDRQMVLSEPGKIAFQKWFEIPYHFPNVILDEFVVMPNHIHGIIIIKPAIVRTLHATSVPQTNATSVPPQTNATSPPQTNATSQQNQPIKNEFMSFISPKSGSLSSIVRSYKSAVTKNLHTMEHGFSWQPRFYDHIIRSDRELNRIRRYIINNPLKWDDKDHNGNHD
ncbi:MAG: transposase [Bacteroidia bacterium]|nr:transposase [Bacteroidia bacterium]